MMHERWPLLTLFAALLALHPAPAPAQDQPSAVDSHGADPVQEAEDALLGAVERSETAGTAPTLLAANLRNLALFYYTRQRYAEARPLHERALAVRERALGATHPDVVQSLDDLALLDVAEGKLESAATRYREALRIQRKLFGRRASQTAITINNTARLEALLGNHKRAAQLYDDELAILEREHGSGSIRLVSTLATLAELDVALGRTAGAEAAYRRGLAIAEADGSPAAQRRLAELLEGYAALLSQQPSRAAEGATLAARAATLREGSLGVDRRAGAD
jgi:tetratricopeptide (TPR) repeat protein